MSIIRLPWEKRDYSGALDSGLVYYLLRTYGNKDVLDQFPGGGVIKTVCNQVGLSYTSTNFPTEDARKLDKDDQSFNTILSHIPYWNAKKYTDHPNDLSNCETYDEFITEVYKSIKESVRVLIPLGYLIFITGDYRKDKKFYPIHSHVLQHVEQNHKNLELKDIVFWELTATSTPFLSTKVMIQINYCLIWQKMGHDLTEVF